MPEAWNYFNYFTEIEEHFQRARGSGLFLLSPIDWALIEIWKNGGIPLEAVLRGIDTAFEKWRSKKIKHREVNSLAYCAQAIYEEANSIAAVRETKPATAPFELEELKAYLTRNAQQLATRQEFADIAQSLEILSVEAHEHYANLERLEQRLTILEDRMAAIARTKENDEDMLQARRELDATLRPYRGKMTADQLAMLERQYLERRLLERAGLPRLSLFYLR